MIIQIKILFVFKKRQTASAKDATAENYKNILTNHVVVI